MNPTFKNDDTSKILLTRVKTIYMAMESPEKHPVMISVILKVIIVFGVGRKKEKGHQIKSLSASQL